MDPLASKPSLSFGELLPKSSRLRDPEPKLDLDTVDLMAEMQRIGALTRAQTLKLSLETLAERSFESSLRLTRPLLPNTWPDLLSPARPAKPPPTYDFEALMATGPAPGGETFDRVAHPLETDECKHVPEQVLLSDKKVVEKLQTVVLEQLARLGPLSLRELVRLTNVPEDLLESIVKKPLTLEKDESLIAASLFTSHPGLVTGGVDRLQLNRPEDARDKHAALVAQVEQHVARAERCLDDSRRVFALAELPADLAPVLASPDKPGPGTLYETMKSLELVKDGVSESDWRREMQTDPKAYWVGVAGQLGSRVVSALHPVLGYQQLLAQMDSSAMAIPENVTQGLRQGIRGRFGPLAGFDLADTLNAVLVRKEALALATALGTAQRNVPDRGYLETFQASLTPPEDRGVVSQQAIAAERAERERGLSTPAEWGRWLSEEYKLPNKIFGRLQTLEGVDRVEVARALPLEALSPRVGEAIRTYMVACLQDQGQEEALRALLHLRRDKELGKSEYGELMAPSAQVRRGYSTLGGDAKRYVDTPGYLDRSRDAEAVRGLLELPSLAWARQQTLSETGTVVPFTNDNLLEDMLVARLTGQTERFHELHAEGLALAAHGAALQLCRVKQGDPIISDSTNGPIVAAAGTNGRDVRTACDLGVAAARARVWARQNGRSFPLSPQDSLAASKGNCSFTETETSDAEGLDYGLLGRLAQQGVNRLEPELINRLMGSDPAPVLALVAKAKAEPWAASMSEQALWRMVQTRPEPTAEQAGSFGSLLTLTNGDVEKALPLWADLERRVEAGEARLDVLTSHFRQASGVAVTETPRGGIAELGANLIVGGTMLRRRT